MTARLFLLDVIVLSMAQCCNSAGLKGTEIASFLRGTCHMILVTIFPNALPLQGLSMANYNHEPIYNSPNKSLPEEEFFQHPSMNRLSFICYNTISEYMVEKVAYL